MGPLPVSMPDVGVAECESATWFLKLATHLGPIGCELWMAIGGLREGPWSTLGPFVKGSCSDLTGFEDEEDAFEVNALNNFRA